VALRAVVLAVELPFVSRWCDKQEGRGSLVGFRGLEAAALSFSAFDLEDLEP
jgi:hypothetical protein